MRLVPKPTDAMSLENHGFRGQNWQKLPLAPVTDGTLLFNTNTNINLDCTGALLFFSLPIPLQDTIIYDNLKHCTV